MNAMDPQLRSGGMYSINAQGQGAGGEYPLPAGEIYPLAAVWLPEAAFGLPAGLSILDMSEISGLQWAFAYGINSSGTIVGQLGQRIGSITYYYGWVWQAGHVRLLHTLVDPAYNPTIIDARGGKSQGLIAATGSSG